MTVEKPKPKQLLRPITTGADSAMNQSQFLAITCNSLEARERSRVQGAIGFAFASHWLKNWRGSFKPITKRSNRNHVITFDSHLKTALRRYFAFLLSCFSVVWLLSSKILIYMKIVKSPVTNRYWCPVHTKTIVNANASKRIFLYPSTRRRSLFT